MSKAPFLEDSSGRSHTAVAVARHRADADGDRIAYTFLEDGESDERHLTFAGLDARARQIGALLQQTMKPGDRALLLHQPGLEFTAALFGCFYAGVIAVPAYPPDPSRLDRTLPRLLGIVVDADVKVILATEMMVGMGQMIAAQRPELEGRTWIATDTIPASAADDWQDVAVTPDDLAFLQYTSGSTGEPKGVMVAHRNVMANLAMFQREIHQGPDSTSLIWLPPYHDMGLLVTIHALVVGYRSIGMSPLHFLQKPKRWAQALSKYGVTYSGGPNFSYELCMRKVTPEERDELDLSAVQVLFSGAEPIRADTLARFVNFFGPCGLSPKAIFPCYGMAENTLAITGSRGERLYLTCDLDSSALEKGVAIPTEGGGTTLVGNGGCGHGHELLIVDTKTMKRLPERAVGEIWTTGPSVALGYWGRPRQTREAFGARLADEPTAGPFLRSGDLGFLHDGELFVTGRSKDLIIIRGRCIYPQDIEQTVEAAHSSVRRGCSAAFSVVLDGEERLVVATEFERRVRAKDRRQTAVNPQRDRRNGGDRRQDDRPDFSPGARAPVPTTPEQAIEDLRHAVVQTHGVMPHAVVLLKPKSIPKTSSGKIQRHLCKERFLSSTLDLIAPLPTGDASRRPVPKPKDPGEPPSESLDLVSLLSLDFLSFGLELDSASLEKTPTELGLDSVRIVELQAVLQNRFGLTVPLSELLGEVKLRDIAQRASVAELGTSTKTFATNPALPANSLVLDTAVNADELEQLLSTAGTLLPPAVRNDVLDLVRHFLGRLEVVDVERLRSTRAPIFLANHQTAVESVLFCTVLGALLNRKIVAVAKAEHRDTWVGEMFREGQFLYYLDRNSRESLSQVLSQLGDDLKREGWPLLVHLAGTRSTSLSQPTTSFGVFESFAAEHGFTVFPVRFTGGLPAEEGKDRFDFPVGLGRQDIYVGAPIAAPQLQALDAGARGSLIIERIESLGPDREVPSSPRPRLVQEVEQVQSERGGRLSDALAQVLRRARAVPDPKDPSDGS